jgi:hypothetical protein
MTHSEGRGFLFLAKKQEYLLSLGFTIGETVWARHADDGMYWPGRITCISNALHKSNVQFHPWSYLIQFFGYSQPAWTMDVLPYRDYQDYMYKNLIVHYEPYPQIKYQFLNAINHAKINDQQSPASSSVVAQNLSGHHSVCTISNGYSANYCSCCRQLPPLPPANQ